MTRTVLEILFGTVPVLGSPSLVSEIMAAGELWVLSYENRVDDRIQARVDLSLLRLDEFVHTATLRASRTEYTIIVQFSDDREGPHNPDLSRLEFRRTNRPPPEPEEESVREFNGGARREFGHLWANPIRARLDYVATSRRMFLVDHVPNMPIPNVSSVVVDPPYAMPADVRSSIIDSYIRSRYLPGLEVTESQATFETVEGFPREEPNVEPDVSRPSTILARARQLGRIANFNQEIPIDSIQLPHDVARQRELWRAALSNLSNTEALTQTEIRPAPDAQVELPEWLITGAWVKSDNSYATIESVEVRELPPSDLIVHFNVWRSPKPSNHLTLINFLRYWKPCDPPVEPTTRFERVLKPHDD